MRARVLAWWSWAVSGFLVAVGAIGLFTDKIGPLPTNRVHALGLNLGVGLVGFGFARFGREDVFVLLAGIGMIALAVLGFVPATQGAIYHALHMDTAESVFELASGAVSLVLWTTCRAGYGSSSSSSSSSGGGTSDSMR
ncbi:MAG TPA: hypothetical protein VLX92_35530 [Kofleriaceae bacterium]|nr:hypothetical protein [Kofleriaceae bacterium]